MIVHIISISDNITYFCFAQLIKYLLFTSDCFTFKIHLVTCVGISRRNCNKIVDKDLPNGFPGDWFTLTDICLTVPSQESFPEISVSSVPKNERVL